jgi:site-specific DNA-methyltransferase (adenine-specific)
LYRGKTHRKGKNHTEMTRSTNQGYYTCNTESNVPGPKIKKQSKKRKAEKKPAGESPTLPVSNYKTGRDDVGTPEDIMNWICDHGKPVLDPCPLYGEQNDQVPDGLEQEWPQDCIMYVNPPFSRMLLWARKICAEAERGVQIAMLCLNNSDTQWWHECVAKADEILFIRSRIKFGGYNTTLPRPVCVFGFNLELKNMTERASYIVRKPRSLKTNT